MAMAMAMAPSSCVHLPRPRALDARSFSPGRCVPRYVSAFLGGNAKEKRARLLRAVDEEGYFVLEENQDRIHPRFPFSHQFNPVDERRWYERIRDWMETVTPIKGVQLITLAALAYTAGDIFLSTVVYNAALWVKLSFTLVYWPWIAAVLIGVSTCYWALRRPVNWERSIDSYGLRSRQLDIGLIAAGTLVWLLLVPLGHFKGYTDGYPLIFFALYVAYFACDAVLLQSEEYGRKMAGTQRKEWIVPMSKASWIGFVGSVVAGHWLAAFEAPPLHLSWNLGWQTLVAVVMVAAALTMKFYARVFLLDVCDAPNSPTMCSPFGPYRFVRHPMYGSLMLLFSGFCLALRAYGSMALILAGCLFYYEQLIPKEEELLIKQLPNRKLSLKYSDYRQKVRKKYVPFLF